MKRTIILAMAAILAIGACTNEGGDEADAAGAIRDVPDERVELYSPVDREALAFGLPDLVQGIRLIPAPRAATVEEERSFGRDLLVKPVLVQHGLSDKAIQIEQKSDVLDEIPDVGVAAVQFHGLAADRFDDYDSSFYLLLTSVTPEMYLWDGEKPAPRRVEINGREVWYTDWRNFEVVWYSWGEVLYVALASNRELLESTMRRMPWPDEVIPDAG